MSTLACRRDLGISNASHQFRESYRRCCRFSDQGFLCHYHTIRSSIHRNEVFISHMHLSELESDSNTYSLGHASKHTRLATNMLKLSHTRDCIPLSSGRSPGHLQRVGKTACTPSYKLRSLCDLP